MARRDAEQLRMVNYVSTVKLANQFINLELLTHGYPAIGFDPTSFAAAKIGYDHMMALVFGGRIAVCPGARSAIESRIGALRLAHLLVGAGEVVVCQDFAARNTVCHGSFKHAVDIAAIHKDSRHRANTRYKWDKFPGLTYDVPNSRAIVNIFDTGRVVVAGARSFAEAMDVYAYVRTNVLEEFAMPTRAASASEYKMRKLLANDTMATECDTLAREHSRRVDGSLAASSYAQRLDVAPQLAIVAPPQLCITDGAPVRVAGTFAGHTFACAFVTDESTWRRQLAALDEAALAAHVVAGCVAASECNAALVECYRAQLRVALGLESSGAQALFDAEIMFDVDAQHRIDTLRGATNYYTTRAADATSPFCRRTI